MPIEEPLERGSEPYVRRAIETHYAAESPDGTAEIAIERLDTLKKLIAKLGKADKLVVVSAHQNILMLSGIRDVTHGSGAVSFNYNRVTFVSDTPSGRSSTLPPLALTYQINGETLARGVYVVTEQKP